MKNLFRTIQKTITSIHQRTVSALSKFKKNFRLIDCISRRTFWWCNYQKHFSRCRHAISTTKDFIWSKQAETQETTFRDKKYSHTIGSRWTNPVIELFNIPSAKEIGNATMSEPVQWNPFYNFQRGTKQSNESYIEQIGYKILCRSNWCLFRSNQTKW